MFGIGKSTEQKQKEKERKKRGTRKYGQGKYKHSRMGVLSCWSAVAALLILGGAIVCGFATRGNAPGIIGGIAFLALPIGVFGVQAAVRGFYERDRSYLTCKIGLPVNAVSLLLFFAIFIGGLN